MKPFSSDFMLYAPCDMDTDGDGWMIIQRMIPNGTVNNQFGTYDQDSDQYSRSCAHFLPQGGWWYSWCIHSSLNGPHNQPSQTEVNQTLAKTLSLSTATQNTSWTWSSSPHCWALDRQSHHTTVCRPIISQCGMMALPTKSSAVWRRRSNPRRAIISQCSMMVLLTKSSAVRRWKSERSVIGSCVQGRTRVLALENQ